MKLRTYGIGGMLLALVVASVALVLSAAPLTGVHVLKPYQEERLTAFLHPSNDPQKAGFTAHVRFS